MRTSKFLVTGGAGFIGSHLVGYLLENGYRVSVLDNLTTGTLDNLLSYRQDIEFIEGDVCDKAAVDKALKDRDYVLHHAAISLVGPTIDDPILAHQVNIDGTLNVLQASREVGVKRFVQASSAAVYGNRPGSVRQETDVMDPLTPYAVTKAAAEYYAQVYSRLYGLETISLRYFNVFGPRQESQTQHASVLAVFVSNLLENKMPVVHGDGQQSRDFVYVRDVCEANLKAAMRAGKHIAGKSYNIGSGEATTVNELLAVIKQVLGVKTRMVAGRSRQGDVRYSRADIRAARQMLGWQPQTSLKEGIEDFVKWYESEYQVAKKEMA